MFARKTWQRGGALAWTAVFFAVAGVPLLALTFDITRLMATRSQLAGATDAGCAALVNSLDEAAYRADGTVQMLPGAQGTAQNIFLTAAPGGSFSSGQLVAEARGGNVDLALNCSGSTSVDALFGLWALNARVTTIAKGRFSASPTDGGW